MTAQLAFFDPPVAPAPPSLRRETTRPCARCGEPHTLARMHGVDYLIEPDASRAVFAIVGERGSVPVLSCYDKPLTHSSHSAFCVGSRR